MLKPLFDNWSIIFNKTDQETIDQIRKDEIDILFDLSGHGKDNRLPIFKNKCAPIQLNWIGCASSTGIKEIDYIIGDQYATPLKDQRKFNSSIAKMISELNIEDKEHSEDREESDKGLKNQEKQERKDEVDSRLAEKEENRELSVDTMTPDTKDMSGEDDKSIEDVEDAGEKTSIRPKTVFSENNKKYKVYTDQFDEVIRAENLESKEELERLRTTLDPVSYTHLTLPTKA